MVRHEILTANKKRKLDHGAQTTTTNAKAVVERAKKDRRFFTSTFM
jgi:hypothetical protein